MAVYVQFQRSSDEKRSHTQIFAPDKTHAAACARTQANACALSALAKMTTQDSARVAVGPMRCHSNQSQLLPCVCATCF